MTDNNLAKNMEKKADFLIEVSWEVCNKVGGINTVLKSKIPQTRKVYGDDYILIGPYFHDKVKGSFEEEPIPDSYKEVCDILREGGMIIHYGKWLEDGNPRTILIDFQELMSRKDQIKKELWEIGGVDSLGSEIYFDEPAVWSWAAGQVIEKFYGIIDKKNVVAVFHEWLSGAGILYVKSRKIPLGVVFVTHATVLGRTLANAGVDMYGKDDEGKTVLEKKDLDKTAYEFGVQHKHLLEKAAAGKADVFSTVSEITGMEAEHILGRQPDVIVPNGLDLDNFPTIEENMIKHQDFKNKIFHFLMCYFFPYYKIDLDNTLIYFTACRYEFHDKGLDILIDALAMLNKRLKEENSEKEIIMFFWVPSAVRGIRAELIEHKSRFKDVEDSILDEKNATMWNIVKQMISDEKITEESLFSKESLNVLKKKIIRFRNDEGKPSLCTHDLDDRDDEIIETLSKKGLTNTKDDKVRVVFYPIYLTGADQLLDLTYYEAIQGGHLGIFPSFYEPWGYTPLEAGALGVASVTSDLAGFGRYLKTISDYRNSGIFVLDRLDKKNDTVIQELFRIMYNFSQMPKRQRIENKFEARRLANLADWDMLISNYIDAHNKALANMASEK